MIERLREALADRYRIERELGAGGMATVYLADDLKHDRHVALKVLKPELAAVVGGERFLTEIKTTANLQHPHILPLFDSGQSDGLLWYAMPYIEGESLRDRLDREKQLPVGEAVAIAAKVAGALQVAHDRGIVHRDIKPANILLMNGEPLVADFGIALAVQEAGGGRLTETGLSMGTPYYMSPEQATADRTPDARADVYSLGCVLYEMLAGEPPFTGSSAQVILGRILTQEPRPVMEERGSVAPNVASAVHRALAKLPADRFPSAEEFARALRDPNAVQPGFETGGHVAVDGGARTGKSGVPGWLPWAVVGVASLAAALFGLGAMVGDGAGTPATPEPVRFSLAERTDPGFYRDRFLRITPDGRTIIFRRRTESGSIFFRRDLGSTEAVPIPGTEQAMDPAISPNGRFLAFNDDVSDVPRVYRLPIDGGTPSTVMEPPNEPIGISWIDDDELLFGMLAFEREYAGLTRTRISNPELRTVTVGGERGDGFEMHHEPEVLAGGTHALFLDFPAQGATRIALVDLETGKTRGLDLGGVQIRNTESIVGVARDRLLFVDNASRLMAIGWDPERMETVGDPVFVPGAPEGILDAVMSPNGTLVMTMTGLGSRPVIVDDRGRVVRELFDRSLIWFEPRLSPDGTRIAMDLGGMPGGEEIWIYDLRTEELRPINGGGGSPIWSEDSRTIYIHDSGGDGTFAGRRGTIQAIPALGGTPTEIVGLDAPSGIVGLGDRLPDGRFLIVEDRGANPDLNRHDLTLATPGDPETRVVADADARELAPRLSPDRRWLAYTSFESGRPQVYVRGWPEGEDRLLVWPDQAGMPVWDPSGDRLYIRTFDGLAAVDLTVRDGRLEITNRSTLFTAELDGRVGDAVASFDVHPDGFIVSLYDHTQAGRIVVWKDWLHELDPLLSSAR